MSDTDLPISIKKLYLYFHSEIINLIQRSGTIILEYEDSAKCIYISNNTFTMCTWEENDFKDDYYERLKLELNRDFVNNSINQLKSIDIEKFDIVKPDFIFNHFYIEDDDDIEDKYTRAIFGLPIYLGTKINSINYIQPLDEIFENIRTELLHNIVNCNGVEDLLNNYIISNQWTIQYEDIHNIEQLEERHQIILHFLEKYFFNEILINFNKKIIDLLNIKNIDIFKVDNEEYVDEIISCELYDNWLSFSNRVPGLSCKLYPFLTNDSKCGPSKKHKRKTKRKAKKIEKSNPEEKEMESSIEENYDQNEGDNYISTETNAQNEGEHYNEIESSTNEHTYNKHLNRYYAQRLRFFSNFDDGILLDNESWYSVTPEVIARSIAERFARTYHIYYSNKSQKKIIIDGFCGAGGNSIRFAQQGFLVIAIDKDANKLKLLMHNARICKVESRIIPICNSYENALADIPQSLYSLILGIYLSPPWGGPNYTDQEFYDIEEATWSHNLTLAYHITNNIAVFLPKNSNIAQICKWLLNGENQCQYLEIEKLTLKCTKKIKGIHVYTGSFVRV